MRLRKMLLLFVLVLPGAAQADDSAEIAAAEQLVRQHYYEGLPYAEAKAVTDVGAARLIEMLADPGEAPYHTNILLALGICGGNGAYAAIAAYADAPRPEELDRATFRALQSAPLALGHLARKDPRALAWLAGRVRASDAPGWRFRHIDSARAARLQRRAALSALGLANRPEAAALLREAAALSATDSDVIGDALTLHRRMAREGADAALGEAR